MYTYNYDRVSLNTRGTYDGIVIIPYYSIYDCSSLVARD